MFTNWVRCRINRSRVRCNANMDCCSGDLLDLMAQTRQLTCPMMARAARFHANQTGLKLAEERRHLATAKRLADNDLSRFINAMNLKKPGRPGIGTT